MKLEEQVVSLELAKKLKELGVKQESVWVWCEQPQTAFPKVILIRDHEYREGLDFAPAFRYSNGVAAFTVAELGEMLPEGMCSEKDHRLSTPHIEEWFCNIGKYSPLGRKNGEQSIPNPSIIADTEADARAKMLIYLIENKLLTP